MAIKLSLQCPLHSGSPHLDILEALLKPVCNCLKGALCARGPSLYKRTGFSQTSCFLYKISFHKDGECFMGFSGKFYILHCPSKVYLTSLMGKWMRVVEVSTFQLLLMNLTKLCTNFISTWGENSAKFTIFGPSLHSLRNYTNKRIYVARMMEGLMIIHEQNIFIVIILN